MVPALRWEVRRENQKFKVILEYKSSSIHITHTQYTHKSYTTHNHSYMNTT